MTALGLQHSAVLLSYGVLNSADHFFVLPALLRLIKTILNFQLCVLFSFFAVSIVLFLVSRFSPHEWRSISISDTHLDHPITSTNEVTYYILLCNMDRIRDALQQSFLKWYNRITFNSSLSQFVRCKYYTLDRQYN